MKKTGILHPEMSHLVASMGHTDLVVIADKGFPIPNNISRIDLGFLENHPTVLQVLKALSIEMGIDRIIITQEMEDISPDRVKELKSLYPNLIIEKVSHQELKNLTLESKTAIKTGDSCPYSNLIVVSG